MIAICRLIFCLMLVGASPLHADADQFTPGSIHRLTFRDVDGNDLSTSDGHVTILTVITRDNEEKARAIADLVPDRCVGDPRYHYVTLVNFQRKLARPFRGLTRAIIRLRLDAEAKDLRPKYAAKNLTRDPRRDLYVIADFDGVAVEQLGLSVDSGEVAVFVFNGAGKLVARWEGVPPGSSLPKAIADAG
jgi:hypothetical protein